MLSTSGTLCNSAHIPIQKSPMNNCRSCGSPTEHVLSLGEMPLANHLLTYPSESYKKYPLDLMFCPSCKLGQLRDQVDPNLMFEEYPYYSSVSQPLKIPINPTHKLAGEISERYVNRINDETFLIAEIGSNDGYLLRFYQLNGFKVLGIDPARGPANAAALKGIPVIQDYFTLKLAKTLPKADVIHAHNVLAHVRDLNDFVAGIGDMLKPNGVCVVEVPYFGNLLEMGTFDQIYAEHNYYFSLKAALVLFDRHEMGLQKQEFIPAHGGSLRLFFDKTLRRDKVWMEEFLPGRDLSKRVGDMRTDFVREIISLLPKGRVWGFGAAAKATTMLNWCSVSSEILPCIADSTPAKIGKFIPGTGQRIVSPDEWLAEQPEYTCIFAWNYEEEIRRKYEGKYKGTFFTPYKLPQ
jgi:SAM-dependent methyltransferase